jgi:hypothetical protein
MNSTRPIPPWVLFNHYAQTFLEKTVVVRYGFADAPPPGVLNVEYARENLFQVPSFEWAQGGQ